MFGRFEAWEIYHRGMGLDINTQERLGAFDANSNPPDIYGATYLFDRPGRAGNVAFHLYPARYLRFELLSQYGGLGAYNEIGGRPAAIYDIGWLKLKAAFEFQSLTAHDENDKGKQRNWGFAGAAQLVFAPFVEGGINYGFADNSFYDQNGNRDSSKTAERPASAVRQRARRRHHRRAGRAAVAQRHAASAPASTTSRAPTSTTTRTRGLLRLLHEHAGVRRDPVPDSQAAVREAGGRVRALPLREGVRHRARLQRHDVQRAPPRPVFVLKVTERRA
jgi:hypothetical protein